MDYKEIKTSSWINGKHELFFYGLVRGLKPKVCVELGTYAGFSAYWMALALKDNGFGYIDCYDMWDKYEFNHVSKKEADKNLKGLPVNLFQIDAKDAPVFYKKGMVDLLYVDISNSGEIYRDILTRWYHLISKNGLIVMEGGTKERDNVDWMKKYKKEKIQKVLGDKNINSLYRFNIISFFPGLTILEKK
jgi:predicted O-methyltransferase YrrM